MKKFVKWLFRIFGLEIQRAGAINAPAPVILPLSDTMQAGMKRARDAWGLSPGTILDLGAAAGTWTIKAQKIWPDAHFVLFEPLEERRKELTDLKNQNRLMDIVHSAAGKSAGKVRFVVSPDLDGSGVYDAETNGGSREVELTTIDAEVARLQAKGPFVIKFDTHGFELPILEGAVNTLRNTDLVIMECYGFQIASGSLRFPEMSAHMEKLGFRLADVVDIMRRPGDQMFWQCDAFFLRDSYKGFSRNSYAEK